MSITARNERLIAYKKLVGKTHTSSQKGASGESIPSSVQSSTPEIFANTPVYDADSPKFCQKVTYQLTAVPGSQYEATTSGTEAQGETMIGLTQQNVEHAFALVLNGDDALQTNTKKQLVPPSFGVEFKAKVFDVGGNQLAEDGTQDWSIDYYSGVLFMQDMGGVTPTTVEAYLYTGKFVSDVIAEVQDGDDTLLKGIVDRLEVKETTATAPEFQKIQSADTVAVISGSAGISGDLEVNGTLHTNKLIVEETTEVVTKTNFSGENIFGDETSETEGKIDTHTFYGNVNINGNLAVTGDSPTRVKTTFIDQSSVLVSRAIQGQPSSPLEFKLYELTNEQKTNLFLVDIGEPLHVMLPDISSTTVWDGTQYIFKNLSDTGTIRLKTLTSPASSIDDVLTSSPNTFVELYAQYESLTIVAYNQKWYIV